MAYATTRKGAYGKSAERKPAGRNTRRADDRTEVDDQLGHAYDHCDGGICMLCDRCRDPECCEQVPCDHRLCAPIVTTGRIVTRH